MVAFAKYLPRLASQLQRKPAHEEGQIAAAQLDDIPLSPKDPQALVAEGRDFLHAGRFDEAAAAFRQAVEQCPDSIEALQGLGRALSNTEHKEEALEAFDRALAISPQFSEAIHGKAQTLLRIGLIERAIANFRRAVELSPDYAEAYYGLGSALWRVRQADEAARAFDKALAIHPDYAEALHGKGQILLAASSAPEAVTAFERALAINPAFTEAAHSLAQGLIQAGRWQEASGVLRRALGDTPANADTVYKLEQIAALTCDAASESRLAATPPLGSQDSSETLFSQGRIALYGGHFHEAARLLSRSVELDRSNVTARCALALAHRRLYTHKDYAIARDLFLDVMKDHAIPVHFVREAAQCCSNVGPTDQAVRLWRQVTEQSPSEEAFVRLSEALIATDSDSEAAETMQKAIALDPTKHRQSIEDVKAVQRSGSRKDIKKGRYPTTAAIQNEFKKTIIEQVAADLKDSPKFITRTSKFFTMGSCFATNIVRALAKAGFDASTMAISDDINSTYANRYFIDWLNGGLKDRELCARIEELLPVGFSKETLLEKLRTCDVYVLTLGVAPSFFDRETGKFIMPRPTVLNSRALAETYLFRTTTVEENVENVLYYLGFIRRLNPNVKIIITESPVPIQMTFEFRSAVVADCLSKSTLRVAAHQIVHHSGLSDIYYWPSFEVVRWLGSHIGPVFGTDDGAAWHVSEQLVDTIVECFIEVFSPPAAAASPEH